jgi:hypothetical protein
MAKKLKALDKLQVSLKYPVVKPKFLDFTDKKI